MALKISCAGSRTRGLWVNAALGSINLGRLNIAGASRALEAEFCNADLTFDFVGGNGRIMYEFSKGAKIIHSSTSGVANNSAVSLVGRQLKTYLTRPVRRGDTILPIAPHRRKIDDVFVGDIIRIGRFSVLSTELVVENVPFIRTSPLPASFPAGTPIIIDQRVRVDDFSATYNTNEFGIVAQNADLTISRVSNSALKGRGIHLRHDCSIKLRSSVPKSLLQKLIVGKNVNVRWIR